MAEISFGGLATGLPTEDIVEGLMAVERRPLERLEDRKESEAIRLQAYKQFDSLLDNLRDAAGAINITSEVNLTEVRLSSEDTISASSDGASKGNYEIGVEQLAQVQKTVTNGFSSDSDSLLGTGTFSFSGQSITIDASNNSLQGLMAEINSLSDTTGISASIINDGSSSENYHLVLTGDDASTSFTITEDLAALTTTDVRTAQQAIVHVDGIEVVSNTNTLDNVIAGVTINLNEASEVITPGDPPVLKTTSLTVENDTEAVEEKIKSFVTSYSAVLEWIAEAYVEDDQTDSTSEGSDEEETNYSIYLRGDSTVNGIKRELQTILSEIVDNNGEFQILSEIGVSTNLDGTVSLDESKLESVLTTKFDDVAKLLIGDDDTEGVMNSFHSYLLDATSGINGMYANKKESYNSAVQRLDDQISLKEEMMVKIEERIRAQFNAMELIVSELNATSEYLTQQMTYLSNLSTGNN